RLRSQRPVAAPIDLIVGPAVFDGHVLALGEARVFQALAKGMQAVAACCARAATGPATAAPPRMVMNSRRLMPNYRVLQPRRAAVSRFTARSACLRAEATSLGQT